MSDICKTIRDELPLWLLAELEESRLAAIDAHVASCKDCALEAEACRRLIADMAAPRGSTRKDASSFFRDRLAPRLEIVDRSSRMPNRYLRAAGLLLAFIAGAASVAAWQDRSRRLQVDDGLTNPPTVATTEPRTPVAEQLVDASAASGLARALRALAAMEGRQR